jgi:hypothetical protein
VIEVASPEWFSGRGSSRRPASEACHSRFLGKCADRSQLKIAVEEVADSFGLGFIDDELAVLDAVTE